VSVQLYKKITTDGLTVNIDLDNPKSFYGAPTVNYAAINEPRLDASYTVYSYTTSGYWSKFHSDAITVYNNAGTNISQYTNTGVVDWTNTYHAIWTYDYKLKKPVVTMRDYDFQWKAKSFTLASTMESMALSAGSKYTLSWLQWTTNILKNASAGIWSNGITGAASFKDGRTGSFPTSFNKTANTWERVYATFTVDPDRSLTAGLALYLYGSIAPSGGVIKIAEVQLESNPYPSKFTYTSRTQSQVLKNTINDTYLTTVNSAYTSAGDFYFNGIDSYYTIPAMTFSNTFNLWSIEVWMKPESLYSFFIGCISNGADNYCIYDPTNQLVGFLYTEIADINNRSIYTALNSVLLNQWSHIVFTINNFRTCIYINGVLAATALETIPIGLWNTDIFIGQRSIGASWYKGYIDLVRIYNRNLNLLEIQNNFNASRDRFGI
jgi:hypothetical protein